MYKELRSIEAEYLSILKEKFNKANPGQPEESEEAKQGVLSKDPALMNSLLTPIEVSIISYKITSELKAGSNNLSKTDQNISILEKTDPTDKEEYYVDYLNEQDGSDKILSLPGFTFNKKKQRFQKFISNFNKFQKTFPI